MAKLTAEEEAEFERCGKEADRLLLAVLDDIPEDVESITVLYALWANIIHVLAEAGWTAKELAHDVRCHAAIAAKTGRMQ